MKKYRAYFWHISLDEKNEKKDVYFGCVTFFYMQIGDMTPTRKAWLVAPSRYLEANQMELVEA